MTSEWQLRIWLGTGASKSADPEFVSARLRDIYTDDAKAMEWMRQSRGELAGRSAQETLDSGDVRAVERLLIQEWWASSSAASVAA